MPSLASATQEHVARSCQACGGIFTATNAVHRFCADEECRATRAAAKKARDQAEAADKPKEEDAPKPPSHHVLMKRAFKDAALAATTDESRPICSADVKHRFAEWIAAREAIADEEFGAEEAYRQSLIELGAAALRVAADNTPFEDAATPPAGGQIQAINKLAPNDLLVAA